MTDNLPAKIPSLTRAFDPLRQDLQTALRADLSSAEIVSQTRRALDVAGVQFAHDTKDPRLHKAGLWLLEMVKSGAGVLDRGTEARITWQEVAKPRSPIWAGRTMFYGAAAAFALAGFVQGSGLVILSAAVLAGLRFLDPKNWDGMFSRLPFVKRPRAIEDLSGRRLQAEAHITADAQGFLDSLNEALNTADHILLRLSEPEKEVHWRDDPRMMGWVQSLLEAGGAKDEAFALKLVGPELESILAGEGIEIVNYSSKTRDLFDSLPAIGETKTRQAAPALKSGSRVLRRGTIWRGE